MDALSIFLAHVDDLIDTVKATTPRLKPQADVAITVDEANRVAMRLAEKDPRFVAGGKGTASQTILWERLKQWAYNNWFVVAFLAISVVVVSLAALGSGLETLFNWIRLFIGWLSAWL